MIDIAAPARDSAWEVLFMDKMGTGDFHPPRRSSPGSIPIQSFIALFNRCPAPEVSFHRLHAQVIE